MAMVTQAIEEKDPRYHTQRLSQVILETIRGDMARSIVGPQLPESF
jgi:hypothetical protein